MYRRFEYLCMINNNNLTALLAFSHFRFSATIAEANKLLGERTKNYCSKNSFVPAGRFSFLDLILIPIIRENA